VTLVRRVTLAASGALALVALGAAPAQAHGPASTLVKVSLKTPSTTTSGPTLRLVAKVALQELDIAYDTSLMQEAQSTSADATVAAHTDELTALFLDRVALTAPDGTAWSTAVESIAGGTDQGQDAVKVVLRATGPPSADTGTVQLTWGVVTDVVVTHDVYVGGVGADGKTSLLATLTRAQPTTTLTVDDPGAGAKPASRSMLSVGFDHFRSGLDHQLFLCLLALGAARRRNRGWKTVRRLAALTAMFTVGHSASLALAASGLVKLPSRWVETGIALTILLAALHAVRPRLPARFELLLTGLFGLVHGFGFAGTLAELSLHGRHLVVPVLTFNLGLELAQLAALALVAVPLWAVARSTHATIALATTLGLVAACWVGQRAFGTPDPLTPALTTLVSSPERLAMLLAAIAVLVVATELVRVRATHPITVSSASAAEPPAYVS